MIDSMGRDFNIIPINPGGSGFYQAFMMDMQFYVNGVSSGRQKKEVADSILHYVKNILETSSLRHERSGSYFVPIIVFTRLESGISIPQNIPTTNHDSNYPEEKKEKEKSPSINNKNLLLL